jgi:hypothetical protein
MSMEEAIAHKKAEDEIEQPQIRYFMAGELGQEEYTNALVKYSDAYRPINQQLLEDWKKSRPKLNRLRDLAEKHIWPDFHSEWLPRFMQEKDFNIEFKKLLRDALIRAKMGSFFDRPIQLAIEAVSLGSGVAVGAGAQASGQVDAVPPRPRLRRPTHPSKP